MTTDHAEPTSELQRAAAFCRLRLLSDTDGMHALLQHVENDGPRARTRFIVALAELASRDRRGRGDQPVHDRTELLAYFADVAAVEAAVRAVPKDHP
jgi:hypothetical protein